MDDFDLRLADQLQRDASLTHEELADRLGSSPSAIQRRIQRLRRQGAIERYAAHIDPKAAGIGHCFVVGLDIERKTRDAYRELRAWLADEDAIQQAYNVTGNADFVLVITAASLDEYDALMSRLVEANPNVRKFTTSVVLQTFKRGTLLPLVARDGEGRSDAATLTLP